MWVGSMLWERSRSGFVRLHVCVFLLSTRFTWGVFVCIWTCWVWVFLLIRLWLLLNKERGVFERVFTLSQLVFGLWFHVRHPLTRHPVIKTILPLSLSLSLSVEDHHYCCNLCCGCCHPPHHNPHPDTIAELWRTTIICLVITCFIAWH